MKKTGYVILTVVLCMITAACIIYSNNVKSGALDGITLCTEIIVPSLLPMLILTNIITKTNCSLVFEKLFGRITSGLFKLPKEATGAIIFGLIGGFPAGAVLTEQLYNDGHITENDASRIMRFNFCGGIAFIITAVGTVELKSTKIGAVLYIINVLSSMILCVVQSMFTGRCERSVCFGSKRMAFSDALVFSVKVTTKNIINMCSYIVFFSAMSRLAGLPEFLNPMIEITNGIFGYPGVIPLPYLAFFLSFGGLCIHFQLIGIIREFGMKYSDFLLHRLAGAIISYFLGKGYIALFPSAETVFSNISDMDVGLSQVNGGLSILLITGCAVIVLDIKSRKSKLL